ncbi:cache domain-containing sensor histidine kinase [Paenibacillus paridis]|uniref:cache domain-containing sensor histidine kinase n=1 Tax=Paenibacillus paridis TaxID=2583376 RepID=UPI00111D2CE1|nr:sensor histidine kinase [Paenibacillus paridis]
MEKSNIFKKILAIMALLLIPFVALYTYSNQVSVRVVQEEIQQNNRNKLSFLVEQINAEFDRFMTSVNNLGIEPRVKAFSAMNSESSTYETFELKLELQEELERRGKTGGWSHSYSLYAPLSDEVVSTHGSITFKKLFRDEIVNQPVDPFLWIFEPMDNNRVPDSFVFRTVEPLSAFDRTKDAVLIGEIRVDAKNLGDMLTTFKSDSSGDPFLYHPDYAPIVTRTANLERIGKLIPAFVKESGMTEEQGTFIASLDDERYMVNYIKSDTIGWYLVEYVPLESILYPITSSRNWFWISMSVIAIVSVLAAFLLYKHVQVPIRKLFLAAKRLRMGDYTVRVDSGKKDEFGYLFDQFNLMSEQIQNLIDRVFEEKLRSREATLKQLQSQINPHFLYNCLFFMKNMTRLGEHDAVMAMAVKLGEYFRYTTHVDQQDTTLRDEIKLISNYLSIQTMRMSRIRFEIEIPETMEELSLPRLILQPIVENAIIHGIEQKENAGMIAIQGFEEQGRFAVVIDDDGIGLTDEELARLRETINTPGEAQGSCGMLNVHQRLIHKYGKHSGLELGHSPTGGLRVIVRWKEEDEDVRDTDRG